jgi:DNA-binding NarL/FixJ family response regulator
MSKTITVKQAVSESEIMVARMLSDGYTVGEMAKKTNRNIRTMEGIIWRMRREYNCENVAHLVATFMRNKLIK